MKMNKHKRILFITDTFGYGGAEKQLAFVADGLLNRGHVVGICNLNAIKRNEGQREIDERVIMYSAAINYRNAIQTNYDYVVFVRKCAKEFNPDVIVGFKQLAGFCASIVGKLLRVPSIFSERADPFRAYANINLTSRLKLWFINRASGGVFQTEQAASFYSKHIQNNSAVIPNPVFLKGKVQAKDYSALPKTVVSLGRIANEQKRLDITLDAFEMFREYHPDYQLKIYGNGGDEALVRKWIKDKGLDDCVKMMGVSNNPINDLSREGIFLITSDYEGISNSLLEAMACGLPVVSTDHTPGGAKLLIEDGNNGLLVPMGDVDAVCRALRLYAEDHSLAEHCGRNAQKVVEKLSPESILYKWESFLLNNCK